MKKVALGLALFVSLSDIAMAKEVGTASWSLDRKNMPGSIEAEGAKVDGIYSLEGTKVAGKFTVKLADFSVGMPLLKTHICEKLECSQYPEAVFTLDPFDMKDGDVRGTLSLHGKTQPVKGWKAQVDGKKVTVKGVVKLTDYGVEPPEYAGIGVSNEAVLTINVNI